MRSHPQHFDIVFICDDSSSNSMGRVLTLWELAKRAEMSSVVVVAKMERVWAPLQGNSVVSSIFPASFLLDDHIVNRVSASLVICVKPRRATLEIAVPWCQVNDIPLALDIDDADIEVLLSVGSPLKMLVKSIVRRGDVKWLKWVQSNPQELPITVSNPVLQQTYGGALLPHVHVFDGDVVAREPESPLNVAFVGTTRPHKGIVELRRSVAAIAHRGFTLTITGNPPKDAHSWETWIVRNTLDEGRQIVRNAGIVSIPSLDGIYARGQLPSKLIEAMKMGKAIVASDLPPIRWALGDAGILVPPGNIGELSRAISSLGDGDLRRQYQEKALARSKEMFAIDKYDSLFRDFVEMARHPKSGGL